MPNLVSCPNKLIEALEFTFGARVRALNDLRALYFLVFQFFHDNQPWQFRMRAFIRFRKFCQMGLLQVACLKSSQYSSILFCTSVRNLTALTVLLIESTRGPLRRILHPPVVSPK